MISYRQGDVYLIRTRKPKAEALGEKIERDGGRVVLAYGEVTGHSHAINDEGATLYGAVGRDDRFLNIEEGATLGHDEHTAIELPAGWYRVVRQREYEPGDVKQRYVAD